MAERWKKQAGETEEASIQREAHVNVSMVPLVSPSRSRGTMRSRVGLSYHLQHIPAPSERIMRSLVMILAPGRVPLSYDFSDLPTNVG